MTDWDSYQSNSAGLPPRPLLIKALALAGDAAHAVDIGCGAGRVTLHLLTEGWTVTAFDTSPAALALLRENTPPRLRGAITCTRAAMEQIALPHAGLVNAAFSLPFCQPGHGPALWQRITSALQPRGLFVGQFFGPEDAWAPSGLWTVSSPQLDAMLSGWEIIHRTEFNGPRTTSAGESKQSHVFDVIARRPGQGTSGW